jgi:uncharacterized protein YcbK (DUF882 family)
MKYFDYFEFDSPDVQGSGQLMSKELLSKLDQVREMYGKPIQVTSGYRTEAHNEKVGGVQKTYDDNGNVVNKGSSHLYGLAADIACTNSADRFHLVQLLMLHNIKRIGIAKTFIHIDVDPDKAQNVIWTY